MSNYLNSCKQTGSINPAVDLMRRIAIAPPVKSSNTIAATMATWIARHGQRRALAALPPHMLNDIGITRRQQIQESGKPFWVE